MANEFDPKAVSSMSSVLNSIDNDRQTYRWFLMLISVPDIQKKLSIEPKIKKEYQNLKNIQITEIITYVVLAGIVAAAYMIKEPWLMVLDLIPLLILLNLFQKNRKSVMAIAQEFLFENVEPNDLNQQTLYQTCEYLSQKYHIPSLVDIITYQDFVGRKVLLGAVLFVPFIYPFKTWQIFAAILVVFLTALAIVNTSLVLRKLK